MKKAVILGNTNLGYSWFVKTFTQGLVLNGVKMRHIDYKSTPLNKIREMILEFKPDAVFTHLSFHNHIHSTEVVLNFFKDLKTKLDVKIIHTCNDARTHDRYMGDISGAFDMALVGSYPMVDNCREAFKVPVFFCPYSSMTYEKMAYFVPELGFTELVFTGSKGAHRTGWVDNRADFLNRLSKRVLMKFFQTQSGNDLRHRTPELSVSCTAILSCCVGYEIPGYMDVRPFQYLGTGALLIMRKFNDMDNYIPEDLYWRFTDYSDNSILQIKELHQRALKEDTTQIRERAFEYIQANHSSKVRMRTVLDILKGI